MEGPKYQTIYEMMMNLKDCSMFGARFVQRNREPQFYNYDEILKRATKSAGSFQSRGMEKGDRVAVILPTALSFFDTFLGTQLGGGIPAALYPPVRLGKLTEYFDRTRRMLNKIGASYLVTDSRIKKIIGPAVSDVPSLREVIDAKDLIEDKPWTPVEVDPDSPAFLQFSSGTTREPKAVIMTHRNLMHNLEMIDTFFHGYSDEAAARGGVCWLPLYHDMGLVGCLYIALYHPGTCSFIPPEQFIAAPWIWMETVSKYKPLISPAPNFAYGLCVSKIKDKHMEGLDLSPWVFAFNGAEPIDIGVMNQFIEKFGKWDFPPETMTPVYGLAEAGLAVTFSDPRTVPVVKEFDRDMLAEQGKAVPGKGRELPSVGKPMKGLEVVIMDDNYEKLPDGHVGRILAHGPSITPGYYNDPEITENTVRDGWLDTGDLGFIFEGDLYICGRAKDLIIIRGRNIAPQEIEDLLGEIEGIRAGCTMAVGHEMEGGEQLLVFAEKDVKSDRPSEEMATEIKQRVSSGMALTPHHVEILAPGTLPRTSSGKMRRADALRMFLSGELLPPEQMGVGKMFAAMGKSQVAWGKFWLKKKLGGEK